MSDDGKNELAVLSTLQRLENAGMSHDTASRVVQTLLSMGVSPEQLDFYTNSTEKVRQVLEWKHTPKVVLGSAIILAVGAFALQGINKGKKDDKPS